MNRKNRATWTGGEGVSRLEASQIPWSNEGQELQEGGKGHVESFFYKLNSGDSERALWVKATAFVPKKRPEAAVAETWVIFFRRGLRPVAAKSTVPLRETVFPVFGEPSPRIQVGDLSLESNRLTGEWQIKGSPLSMDVTITHETTLPKGPMELFFHPKLYELPFPKTKIVTPYPKLRFHGSLNLEGETIDIDGWTGMGGHNWGIEHTPVYCWSVVNSWKGGEDAVFEGVTARARMGFWLAPPITLVSLRLDGQRLDFNGPSNMLLNRGFMGPMRWSFRVDKKNCALLGEVSAQAKESAGLYYRNPDGSVIHCLNSKLATVRLVLKRPDRDDRILESQQGALELGSPDRCYGVTMLDL